MSHWLIEPFTYSFMIRGLAAGIIVGITCAILSAYVVWRGMAFVGDAMAHAILPGIVASYLLNLDLFFGALIAAVLAAVGISFVAKGRGLKEDTAIGVIFSGFFALGILMLSLTASYQDLNHILFGDILGVSASNLWGMAAVALLVMAIVAFFYKELLVTSFDPGHSIAIGLSPERMRLGLLVLLALTVVSALQTVGVVMVLALLVTPAAAASLLTRRLPGIMIIGSVFAIIAAIVGLYASYYFNAASGASIVLTLMVIFIITFIAAPKEGLIARAMAKRRASNSGE